MEAKAVIEKLKQLDAVALVADYTQFPPLITEELKTFERNGVPLALVYLRDARQPPLVLPEALTPGLVLSALDKAGK